jgi:hypothetical protein
LNIKLSVRYHNPKRRGFLAGSTQKTGKELQKKLEQHQNIDLFEKLGRLIIS